MTIANGPSLKPSADHLPRSAGPTEPSGAAGPRRGAFSSPPALGAEVTFRRSPSHHPETGFVRGRMYGSDAIEIVDMDGKPLRLTANQYEHAPPMPTATHGRQPSPASPPPEAGEGIGGEFDGHGLAAKPRPDMAQIGDSEPLGAFPARWWIIIGTIGGALFWAALGLDLWAVVKAVAG